MVSALGAWLLLALVAPLTRRADRRAVAELLGGDVAGAAALAAELLRAPHPAVRIGTGIWRRAALEPGRALRAWEAALPEATARGDVPDQAALDAWVQRESLGLIRGLPGAGGSDVALLLASVLATRVRWATPFFVVPADELGSGSVWAGRVATVLRAPETDPGGRRPALSPGHAAFVADGGTAGPVGVHVARALEGLVVVSVLGAPDAAEPDVLAAAHRIATAEATAPGSAPRRSLFELPLGEGPLGVLGEAEVETAAGGGREEHVRAVLPAWSARTGLDLDGDPGSGLPAAARAVTEPLGAGGLPWRARQETIAQFDRCGFEAATASQVGVTVGRIVGRPGRCRTMDLRFSRPYAVVAAAADPGVVRMRPERGGVAGPRSGWLGLPAFSAWVEEVEEAGELGQEEGSRPT